MADVCEKSCAVDAEHIVPVFAIPKWTSEVQHEERPDPAGVAKDAD